MKCSKTNGAIRRCYREIEEYLFTERYNYFGIGNIINNYSMFLSKSEMEILLSMCNLERYVYIDAHKHIVFKPNIIFYVIGSLECEEAIKAISDNLIDLDYRSSHVAKEDKPTGELIIQCYQNIQDSDVIIAVRKPDGSLGIGTLYELEFAKRIGKMTYVVDCSPNLEMV